MPEAIVAREVFWRRSEIAILASLVSAASNEQAANALRRAAYCAIYSHWEGSVKKMAQAYASSVRKSGLRIEELSICFRGMIAKNAFDKIAGSRKVSSYTMALSDYEEYRQNYVFFDFDQFIRAEGNLTSNVLKEIHYSVGLEYRNFFRLKEKYIDLQLVRRRNLVAHGDNAPIEQDVFELAIREVLAMIDEFSKVILDSFRERKFEAV